MGLEIELPPDPPDRGLAQPAALCHRGPRPVRGVSRGFLQGGGDDLFHHVQQDRRRPARPRLISQPVQAPREEPVTPLADRRRIHSQIRRGLLVRRSVRARQHDLGPQRQCLRGLGSPRPPHQLITLCASQDQVGYRAPRPVMIGQPDPAIFGEPPAPLAHRHPRRLQLRSYPRHTRPRLRARQHNPRPLRQHRRATLRPAGKLHAVIIGQRQRRSSLRHSQQATDLTD